MVQKDRLHVKQKLKPSFQHTMRQAKFRKNSNWRPGVFGGMLRKTRYWDPTQFQMTPRGRSRTLIF